MTDGESFAMPARPFFSCEADCFILADGERMGTASAVLAAEPLLKLDIGEGNVFERRPLRVAERDGLHIAVECDGGEVVHLDLREFTARKTTPDGDFLYRSGLEEGNDGLGFIRAR